MADDDIEIGEEIEVHTPSGRRSYQIVDLLTLPRISAILLTQFVPSPQS